MQISILTFVRHYIPGFKFGGPIRTIANVVDHFGDEFEFLIVTSDRDALDTKPYDNISVDSWNTVGKAKVFYASSKARTLKTFARLIRETPHDVLYLNSLFDSTYTLLPLAILKVKKLPRKPIIIAPRGEFSQGALGLKPWKKKQFLSAAKMFRLYRRVTWHASSHHEEGDIRKWFGPSAKVVVARNLPAIQDSLKILNQRTCNNGSLLIVSLSRIARNKNLDYALRVLARVSSNVRFDIWGTLEDSVYWKECMRLVASMPKNIEINYRGALENKKVIEVLSGYDLFFLPTRGENYGHAIAESLAAGTPVLISDKTPWRNLQEDGVGWDLPLDQNEAAFSKIIDSSACLNADEKDRLKRRVHEYSKKHLKDPSVIESNRQLFLQTSQG